LGRGAIVGFSTHSLAQVRKSRRLPIAYIGFGPIFATSTKPNHSPSVGLAALERACRLSARPVVAIGGIGFDQVRAVLDAGAASAAVISSLMTAKNLAHRMEQLLRAAGMS
jgi:thiamine-phosphate pyrophosphorylase